MRAHWSNRAALVAWLFTLALPRPVGAHWPQQRHDAARTGLAKGASDITEPVAYFKYYLGGSLGGTQLIGHDVDGDSVEDLVFTSDGSVIAKRSDDTTLWSTPPLAIGNIIGLADLNGDSNEDLVLYTLRGAVVLDVASGAVEWTEPEGEMGRLIGVAIGDLTGDGLPDLIMQECGCCGVNSGHSGFVYSFASGFQSAAPLYELPFVSCGAGGHSLTLLDADGSPPLELLNNTYSQFHVLDGATGAVLASSADVGNWTQFHDCRGHDVDGQPGDEILCVLNRNVAPAVDQRKITVMKYSTAGPSLSVLWSKVVAPDAGGELDWVDPFVDLDGDGNLEVAVTTKEPTGVWSTRIFDAATGAELATIADRKLVGTAEIEQPGQALLLTMAGTTLSAYAFDAAANPPVTARWTLPSRKVMTQPDWSRRATSQLYDRVVTIDLDHDGVGELVTHALDGSSSLHAYKATGGGLTEIASATFPGDVDVLTAWTVPPIDVPVPQLAIARSDGYLTLLDDLLVPTNAAPGRPGVRTGGYYASGGWRALQSTPVVAALDGGPAEAIITRNSRKATVRLDVSQASLANPPVKLWDHTHTFAPAVIEGLDAGKPAIAAFGLKEPVTDPPDYRVLGLRADGTELFSVPLEGIPLNDILPADLNQSGPTDMVFQWGHPSNTLQQIRGISGSNGGSLWNAAPIESGSGRQPAGITAHDWNGDGITDVLLHGAQHHLVLSGASGSQIATSTTTGGAYAMATVYDLDGASPPEVILHGSNIQPHALTHDLQTELWVGTDDDRPYPYGAIAPCSAGPVLVEGSWQYPARLKMTQAAGGSAGSYTTVVLAGGQSYADEAAAKADGQFLGQLTSASVHADLTGLGRPTAVVGSGGGWLYGVDPCTGALDFAVDFGTAVGEAVFGDTDGDGRDEILVTVADGYLYGLKNEAIAAPTGVIDTDPPSGIIDTDVDTIVTTDTLYGAWQGVPGAVSYEVAIAKDGLGLISSPSWQDVGDVSSATIGGLPLQIGRRYFFVVRAIAPSGDPSIDVLSDGVRVEAAGGGGAGGGGGTGGGAGAGGASSSGAGGGGGQGGRRPRPVWLVGRSCVYFCSASSVPPQGAPWAFVLLGLALARRRASRQRRATAPV